MQSKKCFSHVRHRLNICWALWAVWESEAACFSVPSCLCTLVELSTLLEVSILVELSLQEVF